MNPFKSAQLTKTLDTFTNRRVTVLATPCQKVLIAQVDRAFKVFHFELRVQDESITTNLIARETIHFDELADDLLQAGDFITSELVDFAGAMYETHFPLQVSKEPAQDVWSIF